MLRLKKSEPRLRIKVYLPNLTMTLNNEIGRKASTAKSMTINKSRLYHTHWQIKRINDPPLFPPNIFLSNAPNLHEQGPHQVAERDPRGNHMASARGHPSSRPCSRGPDQGSPFSLTRSPADKNEFLIHNVFHLSCYFILFLSLLYPRS